MTDVHVCFSNELGVDSREVTTDFKPRANAVFIAPGLLDYRTALACLFMCFAFERRKTFLVCVRGPDRFLLPNVLVHQHFIMLHSIEELIINFLGLACHCSFLLRSPFRHQDCDSGLTSGLVMLTSIYQGPAICSFIWAVSR